MSFRDPRTALGSILSLSLALLQAACASPPPGQAFVAPDGSNWVAIEQIPPDSAAGQLLPTLRLTLGGRLGGSLTVLEGVETLCRTQVLWPDAATLSLRLPSQRAPALRVADGQAWRGVTLRVQVHDELLIFERWNAGRTHRLIVVQDCETESWNLYLRRQGEPTYNQAMASGWDDPDLLGGFEGAQPALSLEWTGPLAAEIRVPGKRYGVTLRERVGDVTVRWAFVRRASLARPVFKTLPPAKRGQL